jgi:hypothetical protein
VKEIQQEYKDRDKRLELNELTSQLCSGQTAEIHHGMALSHPVHPKPDPEQTTTTNTFM